MLVAALKLLALLLGVGLVVGILVMLVVLAIALVRMLIVGAIQWRDLFSFDRWTEVLVTIGRNKLRTALTMISVAWGIFVLVTLLGLGRGLDHGLKKNFARDATNAVWINANKTSVAYGGYDVGRMLMFDNRDFNRAKTVQGIEHIAAAHWIKGQRWGAALPVKRGGKANTFETNAVHAATIYIEAQEITQGRFLSEADIDQHRKSAVLGRSVVQFLFEANESPIGEWIEIGGVPFQVVGVFSDPGGDEEERKIYIPISTAQLSFAGGEKVGTIQMTLGNAGPAKAKKIIDQIVGQLAERYKFSPTDQQAVRVFNNIEQFERFSNLFWMISTFVIVIGLGTLAAGVVGVSNIMMIAVKERTKEIGVRKAIGATPSSIVFMIIQEAVFLTAIAGLLGLAGGVFVCELLGHMKNDFIVDPTINLTTGVGATAFLVLAGAFAGYFPARAAAKVNPIHALRDE
jgi:putative ABC transport system permease protein